MRQNAIRKGFKKFENDNNFILTNYITNRDPVLECGLVYSPLYLDKVILWVDSFLDVEFLKK